MSRTEEIICGIDPGLRATGYGVLRIDDDEDSLHVLDAGVIRCSTSIPLALRLGELAAGLDEVLDEHRVEMMAVEQVYSHYHRPRTAIMMAHARGVALLGAARRNLEVFNLPATTIKKHLTGNGRATKEQMQKAVTTRLGLAALPQPPDVADALAIAMCAAELSRQPAKIAMTNDALLTRRGTL